MKLWEEILALDDLPTEKVEVPEWGPLGKSLFVRTISGTERDAFEQAMYETRGNNAKVNLRNVRARLVVLCLVDESGKRVFPTDDLAKDVGKKSAAALDRIFEVAQKLNRLRKEDVEELAGNFPNGDGSSSDLPSPSDAPSANSSTASTPAS